MTTQNSGTSQKALRAKFGVKQTPIQATQAFKKVMPFDHEGTETRSWILITPDNKIVRANLYNGQAGKNFNPDDSTRDKPVSEKDMKRALKGYEEVPVEECPIAVKA
jgi:hypothetical protein